MLVVVVVVGEIAVMIVCGASHVRIVVLIATDVA
jgi:hypothetical protein